MAEEKDNIQFQLTEELIDKVESLIDLKNNKELRKILNEFHFADIAEILDELDLDDAIYIIKLLDSETTADILMELDEDHREKVLRNLSAKEIAEEIEELDTDDAADIIAELPHDRRREVISNIEDEDHKAEITELLAYDEDTAGGLMAKELVKVYETWTVAGCLRRIRGQAENVTRVHSVYVVTKQEKLIGRLSLKDLVTARGDQKISDIYISNVDYVNVNDDAEEVAKIMQKYDLEAIPVVDDNQVLLGRITIDDIVDVIKEEADKDYQMAAGLSRDVDTDDSIFKMTRARLPWLLIGMISGTVAASIIADFQKVMNTAPLLILFIPLINSSAGNVGVQSSAIVVQSIANKTLKGNLIIHIFKQVLVGLLNGLVMATVIFILSQFWFDTPMEISKTVTIALVTVIINAAVVGTIIPILLNKLNFDPAIATGPFVTTSNDIFGIFIYFTIAKFMLGF